MIKFRWKNKLIADTAIKKLETSNQELKVTLEQINEQFEDIRTDPRFAGYVNDLENLFNAYLKTWIDSNTDIIETLVKGRK